MTQPNLDPDRHKSRGRKERTPAQLDVLAQAREKAKIVIAERAKINALQKTVPSPEPVSEKFPLPPPPEPVSEDVPPSEPVPVSVEASQPENEDEEPRLTRPKYHYINGMYIKIKLRLTVNGEPPSLQVCHHGQFQRKP